MTSPEAQACVLAICLQESQLIARRQVGGPARGYAQFEFAGVVGVLRHDATAAHAERLCEVLDVPPVPGSVHAALEYQDVLCAGFARLLLWTLPEPLPRHTHPQRGWEQYMDAWRPGKPRRERWDDNWARAWDTVRAHA